MSFAFSGVDHVQFAAPEDSEAQAREFFHGVLGWKEVPKPEQLLARGGCWFQCGMYQVHVGIDRNFAAATKAHPAFGVVNIDALRAYLQRHNIEVSDDTLRDGEGIKRFYSRDPFGNRLKFMEIN